MGLVQSGDARQPAKRGRPGPLCGFRQLLEKLAGLRAVSRPEATGGTGERVAARPGFGTYLDALHASGS